MVINIHFIKWLTHLLDHIASLWKKHLSGWNIEKESKWKSLLKDVNFALLINSKVTHILNRKTGQDIGIAEPAGNTWKVIFREMADGLPTGR